MTLLDIFRIVRAHRADTQMADAFRAYFGIERRSSGLHADEIPLTDYQRRKERQEVREAMMQRYGALDRT